MTENITNVLTILIRVKKIIQDELKLIFTIEYGAPLAEKKKEKSLKKMQNVESLKNKVKTETWSDWYNSMKKAYLSGLSCSVLSTTLIPKAHSVMHALLSLFYSIVLFLFISYAY